MFQEMRVEAEEPVSTGSSAPVGTDRLDLEAAEQLIQLSGGDDGVSSESRSADSVKCRGKEKEAAAVESRRRSAAAAGGKDGGDGGEAGGKGAASFACSTAGGEEEKDKALVLENRRGSAVRKDRDGGIVHGEARRRPRFRSLAAIYRETETRPLALAGGGGEGHADRDPSESEGERKKKNKQSAAGDVPMRRQARREEDLVQLARTRM